MPEKRKLRKRALPISEGPRTFITLGPLSTYRLGQFVGRVFSRGVIALFGDLGSGKTVFAKGVADALGVKNVRREVISPSFMMIREHEGSVPFFHIDLYRIGSGDELFQLNLEEYLYRPGVTLVEWADRALSILPRERLEVYFEVLGKKKRRIEFKGVPAEIEKALKVNK